MTRAALVWRGALAALMMLCVTAVGRAMPQRFNEHEVKAAFLFNFVQFVAWPSEAFPDDQAPIVIGIVGQDPFGRVIDDVVKGEHVRNRELIVRRYARVEDITGCHVLFVSASESPRYEQIVSALKIRPTLTVGDAEGFTSQGGMVRFLTERNRIRFEVNVGAVNAAGLTISSSLLRSASIVGGGR